MTIVNSAATFGGIGAELYQVIGTAVTFAASPQTIRVPAGAVSMAPPVTRGYVRAKVYNQTVAINLASIRFQAGDGTNLVDIEDYVPVAAIAISATAWVDYLGDFLFDSLPSASAGGAAGAVINFGATFFNFIIATTGAGGTAAADCEVVGVP